MSEKFICSECGEEMDEDCDICDQCIVDNEEMEDDE